MNYTEAFEVADMLAKKHGKTYIIARGRPYRNWQVFDEQEFVERMTEFDEWFKVPGVEKEKE